MPESEADPDVDIVVPVHNEAHVLQEHVWRLHAYLTDHLPVSWRITIVDNASTDATWSFAEGLAASLPDVVAVHLDRKGRGLALRTAWSASHARVLAYLDVDLSTDLAGLSPLLAPLLSGHSDLAIGTRLSRGSRVVRGTKREFISRSYNGIVKTVLATSFSDAQCGFKAITKASADRLLPLVRDDAWFFDTELLVLAERSGLRIHEVPVDWQDDPDSRVDIVRTAKDDLRGIVRLVGDLSRHRLPVEAVAEELGRRPLAPAARPSFRSQVIRFAVVGGASTVAYALLFFVLRLLVGAQAANFLALLLTAVGNTWANRWFTFGVTGRLGVVRHHLQGLVVFGIAWGITSGSLVALHATEPRASALTEILVLTAANLVATVLRFVLLRGWVFRTRRVAPDSSRRRATPRPTETPMELTK
ncbi:glycosyltransferase [Amnibacterium kyonggiense]|uniref:Glycosyltransferase involved in cell wall biosynthesis n=1 Tax=Amnibacterium kyonggiense TaxID=595671 RepID=A0A4R7FPN8_9MICO|nr:glycosyltransferase [Amnibacterium kyonggiense]TDS79539.1 glycosyltransferase involved in cell wall biosynthesis [Amnibacterium kyonggiense]